MHIARITSKGQTTIPVSIRKAAHLSAGDTLTFEVKGDYLLIRKINLGCNGMLNNWSGRRAVRGF
ncbi:MAG: AbrB/MazE/SpoVT family DNA-binding domain-containing protein [Chlorobium sp.]